MRSRHLTTPVGVALLCGGVAATQPELIMAGAGIVGMPVMLERDADIPVREFFGAFSGALGLFGQGVIDGFGGMARALSPNARRPKPAPCSTVEQALRADLMAGRIDLIDFALAVDAAPDLDAPHRPRPPRKPKMDGLRVSATDKALIGEVANRNAEAITARHARAEFLDARRAFLAQRATVAEARKLDGLTPAVCDASQEHR